MIGARVVWIGDTETVGGIITAVGGRYDDIKAVAWDDGIVSPVGNYSLGLDWDYEN